MKKSNLLIAMLIAVSANLANADVKVIKGVLAGEAIEGAYGVVTIFKPEINGLPVQGRSDRHAVCALVGMQLSETGATSHDVWRPESFNSYRVSADGAITLESAWKSENGRTYNDHFITQISCKKNTID